MSANAINLDQSEILSSGNGLSVSQTFLTKLELSQSAVYPHTVPCNKTGVI